MPQVRQFRLPDVGEGLTEAEVVSWKVRPGDTIAVNDTLVEIETAKSLVELPSPFAGVVAEILVPEGQTVDVGTPIIAVSVAEGTQPPTAGGSGGSGDEGGEEPQIPPADGAVEPGMIGGASPVERTPVLVGYGPRTGTGRRRRRVISETASQPGTRPPSGAPAPSAPAAAPAARATPQPVAVPIAVPMETGSSQLAAGVAVLAKPPVRALAREMGIDLASVRATGPAETITREDVLAAASAVVAPHPVTSDPREVRIKVRGVRKATAQAMVTSAFTAPHVTVWVTVDVTRTMHLVERLRADREFTGVKVTPLLVVAKAVILAARRNPGINAHWDEPAGEIVLKHYVNLGIAAATPRGLVVPNIKDADHLTLRGLAEAMADLVSTARTGRTSPEAQSGGTITITNVGVFGIDNGTPILNPPEAAILGFGQITRRPWVHKNKVKPRWVTQLALSFDHRLVDGDLGSRALADIATVLQDPARGLVWGERSPD